MSTSDQVENNENVLSENKVLIQEYDVCETFDSMNLKDQVLQGIYAYGYEKPSQIQQRCIMPLVNGRDTIGQAQSGTGKTGTFGIAILQRLDFSLAAPQGLILNPTRELAQQTAKVLTGLGSYCDINVHCCIGGQNVREDESILRKGVHVVVGTPGRIYHMIKDGLIKLNNLKILVIDEADVMLEKGFKEQLYEIFSLGFPINMQVALFSATLTSQTLEIAEKFMRNPIKVTVEKDKVNLSGIKQYKILLTKEEFKFNTLLDLRKFISVSQAIIFCNTKQRVITLASELTEMKQSMTFIHGDMDQEERTRIVKEFRAGTYRILISTDILSRGIDVQQVSLVINYDVPEGAEGRDNYIHRIGRSGRYGRKGVAINFVTERDETQMNIIDEYYNLGVSELPAELAGILE